VDPRALLGDKILLLSNGIAALAAIVLGLQFVEPTLAFVAAAVLMLLAVGAYLGARASLASRLLLTAALVGFVILHIQLARGMVEFHFGVFVTLSLLMVYLDWRPIMLGAALFAAHHVLFDRLLASGLGFYCLNEPDFGRVVLHAIYVVVQTSLELMLIAGLVRVAREGDELQTMVQRVNQPDGIALDVRGFEPTTPLGQALQSALQRMQQAVTTMRHSIDRIRSASEEIAAGNQNLNARTESAASSIEQTAASLEEFTTAIRQSDDAAHQAREMAQLNAQAAQRGGQVVGQVVSTMEDINQSSQKIGDIIGVIDGIAFQTNILALNASVEAARAGEQGRGFAVVAAEVRTLAQRSAVAAKEIKELIGASINKVGAGTVLVRSAGTTIAEVVQSADKVSAIIEGISRTTGEEASGIRQINQAVNLLDDSTQRNAALAEQSLAAARSLNDQAEELLKVIAVFKSA
jgi:methyl-accepting chemotaxis protein